MNTDQYTVEKRVSITNGERWDFFSCTNDRAQAENIANLVCGRVRKDNEIVYVSE